MRSSSSSSSDIPLGELLRRQKLGLPIKSIPKTPSSSSSSSSSSRRRSLPRPRKSLPQTPSRKRSRSRSPPKTKRASPPRSKPTRRYADTPQNRARRRVGQAIPESAPKPKILASTYYQPGDLLYYSVNWGPNMYYQVTSASNNNSMITVRKLRTNHLEIPDYFGAGETWAFRDDFHNDGKEEKHRVLQGGKLKRLYRYTEGTHHRWHGYDN